MFKRLKSFFLFYVLNHFIHKSAGIYTPVSLAKSPEKSDISMYYRGKSTCNLCRTNYHILGEIILKLYISLQYLFTRIFKICRCQWVLFFYFQYNGKYIIKRSIAPLIFLLKKSSFMLMENISCPSPTLLLEATLKLEPTFFISRFWKLGQNKKKMNILNIMEPTFNIMERTS